MLISPAYAQAPGGAMGGIEAFLPLILIFVVFYFLLIRPQQKRQKQHKEMLRNIRRGDRIVTNGGIIGKVARVQDTELDLEIAPDTKVKVMRDMVATVLDKTEPVSGKGGDKAKKDETADEETAEGETTATAGGASAEAEKGKAGGLKSLLSGRK
ncbi:Preprotein translocase subunit YajC [Caenispirillum salinarum AK4]|uniref:Sec translocon accessory complex subunit YajC n=1 Tax=Caenispirillum salinarum AK4 TaxID=1238182 RepID=K9HSU5_9PROT|nr:preprotein translocase subunit YajC [Caenispirillum salinarum]EKV31396.1 Preprotein translocase subunit YajC [Caenispirillum salinarum AK4]